MKSIIIQSIIHISAISSRIAMRVSLKKKLRLALFEHPSVINSSNVDDYSLWDLEGHTFLGKLPYNSDDGLRLNAHRGCVRLEYNGQHKLLLPWSIFFIKGRSHVVIPYRQHSIKNPKSLRVLLPATTLSILLILLLTGGVLSQNLIAGTPQKKNISENLSLANDTHLKNPTDETYTTNSAPTVSVSAQHPARSTRPVQYPSTEILKHESAAAKKRAPEGRKIDPLRCQPIIQRHKSIMMNRLAQQAQSEGAWHVCR